MADLPAPRSRAVPRRRTSQADHRSLFQGTAGGLSLVRRQKYRTALPLRLWLIVHDVCVCKLHLSTVAPSAATPTLTVDFDVANTGSRAGEEIAQVYLGVPALSGVDQPPRKLAGFIRVSIDPGKATHANITLDTRAFSSWDVATHHWKVAPGDYRVFVGGSSRSLSLEGNVTVR